MINLIWLLLPVSFGFFAMWKMTEYDLEFYKKQYEELLKQTTIEKRDNNE